MYLKTASGQILNDSRAGVSEDVLWLYLKNMTIAEAATLVFATGEMSRIEFLYGNLKSVYAGYTDVRLIRDRSGTIEVMLEGGHVVKEDEPDEGDLAEDGYNGISGGEGSESGDIPAERQAE